MPVRSYCYSFSEAISVSFSLLTLSLLSPQATYRSSKANRGPLNASTWMKNTQPIMTCYKFVTVHFKWFGIQAREIKSFWRVSIYRQ